MMGLLRLLGRMPGPSETWSTVVAWLCVPILCDLSKVSAIFFTPLCNSFAIQGYFRLHALELFVIDICLSLFRFETGLATEASHANPTLKLP
jgi:hypothetical protein